MNKFVWLLLGAALLWTPTANAGAEEFLEHTALQFSDVYAHHGDHVRNVPFHPGDVLFVHYKILRLRGCNVTVQFRLAMPRPGDLYTGLVTYGYPLVAYYSPVGSYETNEYFEIPRGMPVGAYEMRRQNSVACNNFATWVEYAPVATLTIEAKP